MFYVQECARNIGTSELVSRLLEITQDFEYKDKQNISWALAEIVPVSLKRELSVALASEYYKDDQYLVSELVFHQTTKEDAAFLACEFIKNGYIANKKLFRCSCDHDGGCKVDTEWNNFAKRRKCMKDYEIAIYDRLALCIPVPDDDDMI